MGVKKVFKKLSDLENSVKAIIFFGTMVVTGMGFIIRGYNEVNRSLRTLHEGEKIVKELVIYKELTINAFIDKQFEKFNKDVSDLKRADVDVLSLYHKGLSLSIEQKYKIELILRNEYVIELMNK